MDGTLQPSSAVMFATDGKTFRLLCILLTFMNQNIVEIKWFAKVRICINIEFQVVGTWGRQ